MEKDRYRDAARRIDQARESVQELGRSRELSLVVTKLDEAQLWLREAQGSDASSD